MGRASVEELRKLTFDSTTMLLARETHGFGKTHGMSWRTIPEALAIAEDGKEHKYKVVVDSNNVVNLTDRGITQEQRDKDRWVEFYALPAPVQDATLKLDRDIGRNWNVCQLLIIGQAVNGDGDSMGLHAVCGGARVAEWFQANHPEIKDIPALKKFLKSLVVEPQTVGAP